MVRVNEILPSGDLTVKSFPDNAMADIVITDTSAIFFLFMFP